MRVPLHAQPSGGLSLLIPADYAAALHLSDTTAMELTLRDDLLTLAPPLRLAELLAAVSPGSLHAEMPTGTAKATEQLLARVRSCLT